MTKLSSFPQRRSMPNADSVLIRALQSRNLTATDQLFSVSDYDIVNEIHPALLKIKQLINEPNYLDNQNDQKIVEFVLSRITSAIRETNCIEVYSPALIDLLESCSNRHWMTTVNGTQIQDSPHCKIVLEILSALYLNHNKAAVMILAVPATLALFERTTDSESLLNTASSMLCLASLHNGKILAQYAVQLIKHILKGNHSSLIAILPHIYAFNSQAFNAYLVPLLRLLYHPNTGSSEKLQLLQFAVLVSNESADLIIPHLSELDDYLLNPTTCAATLQIFLSLINHGRVSCLTGQLLAIRLAAQKDCSQHNLLKMVQIVASVARSSENMRLIAMDDIICIFCQKLGGQALIDALKEVEAIAELYPHAVLPHVETIKKIAERHPIAYVPFMRIKSITSEIAAHDSQNPIDYVDSIESLTSKRSSRAFPSDPAPLNQTAAEKSIGELDRNMKNLADRMRSTGSLGQHRSRSFLSLTASSKFNEEKCQNCSKVNRTGMIPPLDTVEKPSLPPVPLPNTQIQLGRDGRVRPVMQNRARNPWIAESSKPNNSITTTTTFPVFTSATKRNTLSGSQVRMVDEHSAKSRQLSMDTLVGRNNWTTSQIEQGHDSREIVKDDVVKQFFQNRRSKIRRYIYDFNAQYPIPVKCSIEGSKPGKSKMKIYFACQSNGPHCMFSKVDDLFAFKTKLPEVWLQLMFLHVQTAHMHLTCGQVLDQNSNEFQTLANCWDFLPSNVTKSRKFSNIVVSQFPTQKEKSRVLKELQDARFFDNFVFNAHELKWSCVICANPARVQNLIQGNAVLLEGRLKEKRPRFWFLPNRWNSKYFQLSPGTLTCKSSPFGYHTYSGRSRQPEASIDLNSVRSLSRGRKNRKSLQPLLEIQTNDNKYVLKADDRATAEAWYECLQIAVAQAKQQKQQMIH